MSSLGNNKRTRNQRSPSSSPQSSPTTNTTRRRKLESNLKDIITEQKNTKYIFNSNEDLRKAIEEYRAMDDDLKPTYSNHWVYGKFNDWDVSKITDMSNLFEDLDTFNEELNSWNVGNVKDMESMFDGCESFNQPIGMWDVSKVENMRFMFKTCESFNQELNSWNVGNVKDMESMFDGCESFNQELNSWNVGNVTNMETMFDGCNSFNQELNSWDVGKVENMKAMFNGCKSFNQTLNSWNVGNVTNMESMFDGCESFNQPIGMWNVSKVSNMQNMFKGCNKFNQNLNEWNVRNVRDLNSMFEGCQYFNQPLNKWKFYHGEVYGMTAINMSKMFKGCMDFNQSIEDWDTHNVVDMSHMFSECENFNQPLEKWDVSNVSNMAGMFSFCVEFNQPLEKWETRMVESMKEMFYYCYTFNQPLERWETLNVLSMEKMFSYCEKFDQALNQWNTQNVENMYMMFYECRDFNQPLHSWKVSNVKDMGYMFYRCQTFDQYINDWDVGNVFSMYSMFGKCYKFNQPLDDWNVENVTEMASMFEACMEFNQSIENWDIKNVGNFFNIFKNCPAGEINKTLLDKLEKYKNESLYPSLSLKDLEFSKNIEEYKKIKPGLYDNRHNTYKIHIEKFDNHEFPIITLPKGLMLYTYTSIKDKTGDIYNINRFNNSFSEDVDEEEYSADLKFFYPIPYYAHEIKPDYMNCHICVLNRDIRLFAAIRPSPITRSDLKQLSTMSLNRPNNGEYYRYYKPDYSKPCENGFSYDPCLSNELKQLLNIDGFIGIPVNDSITSRFNSEDYDLDDEDSFNIEVLKKIFAISALNAQNLNVFAGNDFHIDSNFVFRKNRENDDIQYNVRMKDITLKNMNSIFGIPEITLNLFNNKQFNNYRTLIGNKDTRRPSSLDEIKSLEMNFKEIHYCGYEMVQPFLNELKDKIVFTKQAPILFHLHIDYINKSSDYFNKYVVKSLKNFNFPDAFDYNQQYGPSIEMLGYKYKDLLLNDELDNETIPGVTDNFRTTGGRAIPLIENNNHNILNNNRVFDLKSTQSSIRKHKKEKSGRIIMQETIQGIPILFIFSKTNLKNMKKQKNNKKKGGKKTKTLKKKLGGRYRRFNMPAKTLKKKNVSLGA